MSRIIRLTESDLNRLVKRVIKESNQDGKVREFVELFLPLGSMWVQNENDSTAKLVESNDQSPVNGRLSFKRIGKDIICKLKRDGITIVCSDKGKIFNFDLNTELNKLRKWLTDYQR